MLELRPNCECCNRGRCPNCGGELVSRPRRPAGELEKNPASTRRVYQPDCQSRAHQA